jgi:hypothetical protein
MEISSTDMAASRHGYAQQGSNEAKYIPAQPCYTVNSYGVFVGANKRLIAEFKPV